MITLASLLEQILEENRIEVLKQKFVDPEKVTQREFDRIVDADPTPNKAYTQWILTKFVKDIKSKDDQAALKLFFEDLYKIKDGLELFNRLKRRFTKQDINQYSLEEFAKEAFELSQTLNTQELEKGKEKTEKYSELKLGNVDGFTVYKLPQGRQDLKPVACELGSGTNWCTADSRSNYYNTYNRKDPLFIFIKGGEKYQYHQQSGQFMDKQDRSVDPNSPLIQNFLAFLEKAAGRVHKGTDIAQYKIGSFESEDGPTSLYKVGHVYYAELQNRLIGYDLDTHRFKTKDGNSIELKNTLTSRYIPFIKEVYKQMKANGEKGFPSLYRLLLNLDVPPREWYEIPEGLNLSGTDLNELPEGLWIHGDLNLSGSNITQLPKRIKVDGEIIRGKYA